MSNSCTKQHLGKSATSKQNNSLHFASLVSILFSIHSTSFLSFSLSYCCFGFSGDWMKDQNVSSLHFSLLLPLPLSVSLPLSPSFPLSLCLFLCLIHSPCLSLKSIQIDFTGMTTNQHSVAKVIFYTDCKATTVNSKFKHWIHSHHHGN